MTVDAYIENYMALAVSILGNCPPDTAFRRLYGRKKLIMGVCRG